MTVTEKWLTMGLLCLSGSVIFWLPLFSDIFYVPMQNAFGFTKTQMGLLLSTFGAVSLIAYSANRGDYVTFAALGVDIITAKASGGYHQQTGTSIAAPFVSAILTNISSTEQIHIYLQKLKENTIDLGPPGFDDIYGYGLIQAISE